MNTEPIDLSNVSEEALKAALQAKQSKKTEDREAYKELVAATVPEAMFKLAALSEQITNAKCEVFQYFKDVLKLKAEVYGIKDKQQSHTFSTDHAEVTIGYRVADGWDNTAGAGIEKVKAFLETLAKDANSAALVETVFNLLKKDAKGNLKGSRVLELQKLTAKFNNEEFTDGVDIISKAFKPKRTSWFIEAYLIDGNGNKTNVPLSMSAADFPKDFTFDFDLKTEEK